MPLDLSPEVEHQVLARARAAGTTANDYIARLLQAAVPDTSADSLARIRSLLAEWQKQDNTPIALPAANEGALSASEALFRQWEQEDATLTDEERQAQEELWQQFQLGINAERAAAGMRAIF